MSKVETDEVGGVSHKDVSLTTALQSLKGTCRVSRPYKESTRALHGEGTYRLDMWYSKFSLSYDNWKVPLPG